MTSAEGNNVHPKIKFRWCHTVPCRTQEVLLVLTSLTGTRVLLTWQPQLGWYEAPPAPITCGLHTGFILIKDKVKDSTSGRSVRERDYRVDPFHVVPHDFAVELFLESQRTSPFWTEAPDLRLRYLSSEHLERLGGGPPGVQEASGESLGVLRGRRWASLGDGRLRGAPSKCEGSLSRGWRLEEASEGPPGVLEASGVSLGVLRGRRWSSLGDGRLRGAPSKCEGPAGALNRGRSQGHLDPDSLRSQGASWASSPNLSRAFRVALDLSRASSRFLAGLSTSTSSGVCLEDGSEPPPTPPEKDPKDSSPYEAGGESSQDSQDAGGRGRRYLQGSRDRLLRIEDLGGRSSSREGSSFEDDLPAASRSALRPEVDLLLRLEDQERLVGEVLADSDFEDDLLEGPYGCLITFESRSSSMEDMASTRELEDVLVSLTSSEVDLQKEGGPPSTTPDTEEEVGGSPSTSPDTEEEVGGPPPTIPDIEEAGSPPRTTPDIEEEVGGPPPTTPDIEEEVGGPPPTSPDIEEEVGGPPRTTPDIEEDVDFQYDSLKEEEHLFPIDLRESEDSLEGGFVGGEERRRRRSPAKQGVTIDSLPRNPPTKEGTSQYSPPTPRRTRNPPTKEGTSQYSPPRYSPTKGGSQDSCLGPGRTRNPPMKEGSSQYSPPRPWRARNPPTKEGTSQYSPPRPRTTRNPLTKEGTSQYSPPRPRTTRNPLTKEGTSQYSPQRPMSLRDVSTQTPGRPRRLRAPSARWQHHQLAAEGGVSPRRLLAKESTTFSALPDRLVGPWSLREVNPGLRDLQRSLHGLQEGRELRRNTDLLRELQAHVVRKAGRVEPVRGLPPNLRRSPVRYRYPVLDSSIVRPSNCGLLLQGAGRHRRSSSFQHRDEGRGRVRGASSLPDLYDTHSTYPGPSRPAAQTTAGRRSTRLSHAHSVDLMVGSRRRLASPWNDEEGDSGGSTDSLIDEAEHATTTSLDPSFYRVQPPTNGWDVEHRKQHRQRRRRTRSHHGAFSSWRSETEASTGTSSGRPYLPYRSDQLSPGQQVKVIAPGGGVAVARVLANARSSEKVSRDPKASAASVTVILLKEPNRLQGSVVTIPLEKVLLAWPRT